MAYEYDSSFVYALMFLGFGRVPSFMRVILGIMGVMGIPKQILAPCLLINPAGERDASTACRIQSRHSLHLLKSMDSGEGCIEL